MKQSNKSLVYLIIPYLLFLLPALLHAQPSFTDDVSDVPVDGGLALLVVTGVGYSVQKLRNNMKKK